MTSQWFKGLKKAEHTFIFKGKKAMETEFRTIGCIQYSAEYFQGYLDFVTNNHRREMDSITINV